MSAILTNPIFMVIMTLASAYFVYDNVKGMMAPMSKVLKDQEESAEYAEKLGKNAIFAFTVFTVCLSVGYVIAGRFLGLIPSTIVYVFVIFMMINLMMEQMCLTKQVRYNKGMFFSDKLFRVMSGSISCWIIIGLVFNIRPF